MAASLAPALAALLNSLPSRPLEENALRKLVKQTLDSQLGTSDDNRKSQWEFLLKNEIYTLVEKEGAALQDKTSSYYDDLRDRLDVILVFTEQDACDQSFPFTILQDLLETQTIASCSHIFSWIEERSQRLTSGMVPQKGKALVLLRTLNDLLRRLSKMGSTTVFCGRILTFLSGVFPLGERSGVNLRGEYGPLWEVVNVPRLEGAGRNQKDDTSDAQMQVDDENQKSKSSVKSIRDLHDIFWSLQVPFSRPTLFGASNTLLPEFKESVNKVLPYIKEANAKDRAMLGSRSGSGMSSLKRKRETEPAEESNTTDYFFAKYLTSPELLELEIADTHFRRQFLFQLIILLQHLLTFTKSAKSAWSTPRNRSLQMEFTLEAPDAQWVQETINKAMDELRQTTPNGRAFAETVNIILEREKNWVRWKNDLCAPFDKEPWRTTLEDGRIVGLEEATGAARVKMRAPPENWPHKLGSAPLTEIWEMGYRDLRDLENPFHPGEVKDYARKVQQEDARIEMRKKTLARTAERLAQMRAKAAAGSSSPAPGTPAPPPESSSVATLKTETSHAARPSTPIPAKLALPAMTGSPLHPSLPAKPGSSTPQKSAHPMEAAKPASPPPVVTPAAPASVTPAPLPLPLVIPPATMAASLPVDDQLAKLEENKHRWSWFALRMARDSQLLHFGKIGTGDIVLLAQEIEKEIKDREEQTKGAGTGTSENFQPELSSAQVGETGDDYATSPLLAGCRGMEGIETQKDVDGEAKTDS